MNIPTTENQFFSTEARVTQLENALGRAAARIEQLEEVIVDACGAIIRQQEALGSARSALTDVADALARLSQSYGDHLQAHDLKIDMIETSLMDIREELAEGEEESDEDEDEDGEVRMILEEEQDSDSAEWEEMDSEFEKMLAEAIKSASESTAEAGGYEDGNYVIALPAITEYESVEELQGAFSDLIVDSVENGAITEDQYADLLHPDYFEMNPDVVDRIDTTTALASIIPLTAYFLAEAPYEDGIQIICESNVETHTILGLLWSGAHATESLPTR